MKFNKKQSMFKTGFAEENWQNKYQFKTETPIGTFIRIANYLASVETETLEEFEAFKRSVASEKVWINYGEQLKSSWAYKFLITMVNFDDDGFPIGLKCTPGGRITANAGTDYKNATLLNCFINAPVKDAEISYNRSNIDKSIAYNVNIKTPDDSDDLVNIFLTILEHAKILASEAGIGLDCCGRFDTPITYKRNNIEICGILQDIIRGDLVLSRDGNWHSVEDTLNSVKEDMVSIELENGEILNFTSDHPFLVKRDGKEVWIIAELLKENDELINM